MHGRFLAIAIAIAPLAAHAMGGYVEGNIGFTSVNNVGVVGTDTDFEYDSGTGGGLELGIRGFEEDGLLRFGLAWDHFDAELDRMSYTTTDGLTGTPVRHQVSGEDLKAAGQDYDISGNVYTANLYRDFRAGKNLTLYLGGGLGIADVDHMQDTPLAWRFAAGARYYLTEGASLGVRWDYLGISEPEGELGTKYDNINTNRVGASAMFEF